MSKLSLWSVLYILSQRFSKQRTLRDRLGTEGWSWKAKAEKQEMTLVGNTGISCATCHGQSSELPYQVRIATHILQMGKLSPGGFKPSGYRVCKMKELKYKPFLPFSFLPWEEPGAQSGSLAQWFSVTKSTEGTPATVCTCLLSDPPQGLCSCSLLCLELSPSALPSLVSAS
jgi:hypothetical protein